VRLSQDDWLRLVTWVDGNAPYHSNFLNMRPEKAHYDLPADKQLLGAIGAVHARRCTPCHTAESVTRADWIDLGQPEQSRFLAAPLANALGSRKCPRPTYAAASDADYRAVLKLVDDAVKRAWSAPRRDLQALLPLADHPQQAQAIEANTPYWTAVRLLSSLSRPRERGRGRGRIEGAFS